MSDELQLQSLLDVSPAATLGEEGGVVYVLMPKTKLQTPAGIEVMDVVLCPRGQGSYATRLLLDRKVESKPGLNWQAVPLIKRIWHTFSWNHISANQPWVMIFAEHARVLR